MTAWNDAPLLRGVECATSVIYGYEGGRGRARAAVQAETEAGERRRGERRAARCEMRYPGAAVWARVEMAADARGLVCLGRGSDEDVRPGGPEIGEGD